MTESAQTNTPPADRPPCTRGYVNLCVDLLYDPTLTPEAKVLWCILKQHAQTESGACWPSHERLQELLGKSDNVVRAAMNELVHAGHVKRTRRGRGRTNLYTLLPYIRNSESEHQEPKKLRISASRDSESEPTETQNLSHEVVPKEVVPKEVVITPRDVGAQARALIGGDVFTELTKHLLVAGSEADVETVAEAIIAYPPVPHMLEARRCKSRNGSWHSKTSAQRASLFASWLATADAIRLERAEKFGVRDRPNADASVEPILPANVGLDVSRAFEIVSQQLPPEEYNRYMGRITTSEPNGTTIWVNCADPKIRERMKSRYLPLLTLAFHEIHSPLRPQLAPDAA